MYTDYPKLVDYVSEFAHTFVACDLFMLNPAVIADTIMERAIKDDNNVYKLTALSIALKQKMGEYEAGSERGIDYYTIWKIVHQYNKEHLTGDDLKIYNNSIY